MLKMGRDVRTNSTQQATNKSVHHISLKGIAFLFVVVNLIINQIILQQIILF